MATRDLRRKSKIVNRRIYQPFLGKGKTEKHGGTRGAAGQTVDV